MAYLDFRLLDGHLSRELYGRILWCIHRLRYDKHDIRADFPDIQHQGLGFVMRCFGQHDALELLATMTQPLQELELVRVGTILPVPEGHTSWVVSYRRSQGDSRRYSPARARRLARRARERGEHPPTEDLNKWGGITPAVRKGNPRHIVWISSVTTPHNRKFSIALARQTVPGPDAVPSGRTRWAGNSYGLGFVVPDLSPATHPEAMHE